MSGCRFCWIADTLPVMRIRHAFVILLVAVAAIGAFALTALFGLG